MENDDGKVLIICIVGYDEIFDCKDVILVDVFMVRVLIGKEVDDEVMVVIEVGCFDWWINKIWYDIIDKI